MAATLPFGWRPQKQRFCASGLLSCAADSGHELSLLARLVRTEAAAPPGMWADEARAVAAPGQAALMRAQQAASLAGVGRAVYDALLERIFETDARLDWTVSTEPLDSDCLIKGNINTRGERIYHVPGGQFYEQTIIDEAAGQRWFCSEEEALDAGWRPSRR